MTTTVIQDATPEINKFVHAQGIQEVIDSLDDDMATIRKHQINGDYVKEAVVMDVLLDVRNKLTSLIE